MTDTREWQDISTAPRDGTSILVIVAGRHPDTGIPFIPEVVEWNHGGYWWNEMWGGGDNAGVYEPTHWMTLPLPPAPQEKG